MGMGGDLEAVFGRFRNHRLLELPPVSEPKHRTDHATAAIIDRGLD